MFPFRQLSTQKKEQKSPLHCCSFSKTLAWKCDLWCLPPRHLRQGASLLAEWVKLGQHLHPFCSHFFTENSDAWPHLFRYCSLPCGPIEEVAVKLLPSSLCCSAKNSTENENCINRRSLFVYTHSKKENHFNVNSSNETVIYMRVSVQFSSVTQSCLTLCYPMNSSTLGLPAHHHLPEFTQTHVHRVRDAIQPFHPRSSPSPPAPNPSQHQSLFQWVNSSHEVAKVLEFQL